MMRGPGGEGDDGGAEMDFDQEELMMLMEAAENPLEKAVDQDFFRSKFKLIFGCHQTSNLL